MIKPMTVDPDLYSMRAIRETAAYMDGILEKHNLKGEVPFRILLQLYALQNVELKGGEDEANDS